jgi:hypothetical protein
VSEHSDYSRLKQRARQKATLEQSTKTLVVKDSVLLVDLTGEVEKVGNALVSGGSQLYGVAQSPNSMAMVSPWCNSSTLTRYLEMNPEVDRFALVSYEPDGGNTIPDEV